MKRIIVMIIMIPVFVFSYFLNSWTASYLPYVDDWKEHLYLTPETVTDAQQIYEIDKFLYAFHIQPMISVVCLLSFLLVVGIMVHLVLQKMINRRKVGL
ncbi:DUF4306 domain-containing protein [Bacillus sp. RAR_GA_16]|uniref:DUF4306 domain-containing protein n=1 Tax=Bacillus sp. RAR_GA_16 TaxID=2876774 RepID=UPI001CC94B4D|nr:DUF4306 domain-containing protein [Bacillus sp. RAR_GA_16]MCA0173032.1 YjdJ family protein [Bacillus sp. RAR_GA_16]